MICFVVSQSHLMFEMLFRAEQSKLLGFENYSDMSMQTKMAGNVDNVRAMLATLFTSGKK